MQIKFFYLELGPAHVLSWNEPTESSKTVRHARWVQGVASHGWTDVAGSEGGIQTIFPGQEKG